MGYSNRVINKDKPVASKYSFKAGEEVIYDGGRVGIVIKVYPYFVLLKDKIIGYKTCKYPENLIKVKGKKKCGK